MSVLSCVGKATCSPGASFFESSHSESVQEMYRRLLGFFAETRESVAQSKAIKNDGIYQPKPTKSCPTIPPIFVGEQFPWIFLEWGKQPTSFKRVGFPTL